jgi:GDP-L-fucose synthase
MDRETKIFIAGHDDVMERCLVRHFRSGWFRNVTSSSEKRIDLTDPLAVRVFFMRETPEVVILTSIRSGGIGANQAFPGEFIYQNLQAQNNVIHIAHQHEVKRLLFVSASCVYPKECPQPMKESHFLTGAMEKTSEPYAMAKAAGIVMCQAYRKQYDFNATSIIPATVYGPGDGSVSADHSHVMEAMLFKFHQAIKEGAKYVELWGTGDPRREFLYADDFAAACRFVLEHEVGGDLLNAGTGTDVSIRELAMVIQGVSGFKGEIRWNTARPDGAQRKLLDSSRLFDLGWRPQVSLADGIRKVYQSLEKGEVS